MSSIFDKLSQLPLPVKQKLSSPEFLSSFSEIDQKYGIQSAIAFMDFALDFVKKDDLPLYLSNKFNLNPIASKYIANIFVGLADKLPELRNVADNVGKPPLAPPWKGGESKSTLNHSAVIPAKAGIQEDWILDRVQDDKIVVQDDNRVETNRQTTPSPSLESRGKESNISQSLSFDAEDEEEINEFKQNIPIVLEENYNYDELSDIIIKEINITFSDDVLQKRLKNIIILNLKGIRDGMETKDALTKSQKIGGMEMDSAKADEIVKVIKKNKGNDNVITSNVPLIFPQAIQKNVKKIVEPSNIKKPQTLVEKMKREGFNAVSTPAISSIVIPAKAKIELNKDESLLLHSTTSTVIPGLTRDPGSLDSSSLPTGRQVHGNDKGTAKEPKMSIEVEDGLPVIRMPDDLMVKPKIVDFHFDKVENKEKDDDAQKAINLLLDNKENKKESTVEEIAKPEIKTIDPASEIKEGLPPPTPNAYSSTKTIPQRIIDAQNTRRPILDGIRLTKKLTGPIEELGEMTLIEFRRLASDPESAAREIREKVKLLEDDSYVKKMEGINAWFKNEINKFYRLLGSMAMEQHRNIDDVIKERLLAGKPTLTIEEFDAIMKLNKDLRY